VKAGDMKPGEIISFGPEPSKKYTMQEMLKLIWLECEFEQVEPPDDMVPAKRVWQRLRKLVDSDQDEELANVWDEVVIKVQELYPMVRMEMRTHMMFRHHEEKELLAEFKKLGGWEKIKEEEF
jgi:hypothetical protein